jgi:hypothetical protein
VVFVCLPEQQKKNFLLGLFMPVAWCNSRKRGQFDGEPSTIQQFDGEPYMHVDLLKS